MDSMNLEFLARETMELSQQLSKQQNFSFEEEPVQMEEIPPVSPLDKFPARPGLLFFLEKGISTFAIRALATANAKDDADLLMDGNPELLQALKIKEELPEFFYFETPDVELAEVIQDQLGNRRFPVQEDILCNISDPGFSWWLDLGEDHFQIYFKSHGISRADQFIRFGPLGDKAVAAKRWEQFVRLIGHSLPINEFGLTEHGVSLSMASKGNSVFKGLQLLLKEGEFSFGPEDFGQSRVSRTLYFYFRELAFMRRFWLEVEKVLES